MANLFENKDRRVIPNWRSFKTTSALTELSNREPASEPKSISILEPYINDWEESTLPSVAGDLLSAAIVNGLHGNPNVIEYAKIIAVNITSYPKSTVELANYILGDVNERPDYNAEITSVSQINDYRIFQPVINNLRAHVINYPGNAIKYVDLSRIFSIIGLEEKAKKSMGIALHLSKNNRFILRAASRLYSHYNETEYIHHIIKSSDTVKSDPWVLATEISLSTVLGKTSTLIKNGLKILENDNFCRKSLSELAAAIATSEYYHGNTKKSKKLFKMALIDPNENALAQIEWVNEQSQILDLDVNEYNIPNNFEAIAYNRYIRSDYDAANKFAIKWFLDLPFSKRAIMFSSFISNSFLGDTQGAIKLLLAGLISHPNDSQILNNLAYSYALINRCDKAEKYLSMSLMSDNINDTTRICNTATAGLIAFRRHDYDKGHYYYKLAIEQSQRKNLSYFVTLARINYARELLLTSNPNKEDLMKLIDQSKKTHFKEHKHAITNIENLIKRTKFEEL